MTSLWLDGRAPVPARPFEAGLRYDDAIVGAGLTGLVTGLLLAEAGRRVVILEAFEVGALASGNTTGKLSLLQGSRLSTIRAHHSRRILQAYVDSNRDGMDWLLAFCESVGVPIQRRTAYSYAQRASAADQVAAEYDAAREAGLPVSLLTGADLATPFPLAHAVALPDQAQFDPMDALDALAAAFVRAGGTLHTGVRVTGVRATASPARVLTEAGEVLADSVVLATATPILDRGLYFAKVHGQRSYAASFESPAPGGAPPDAVPDAVSEGMFLSIGDPPVEEGGGSRSVRTTPRGGAQLLVIGGNGHEVGRPGAVSERERIDDLVSWTERHFPGASLTHTWSAQDYESHNLVPFVGSLPRGRGRVYIATGYAKWGMTNAPAAALRLRAEILGRAWADRRRWHQVLGTRVTRPADLARGAEEGAHVALETAKGWLGSQRRAVPVPRPAEGEGTVASQGVRPVAVSTVDGATCAVSAVCTHLGGVVRWNDAERTWDCPLHASRFAADGTRIEGPAVADLPRLPR